MAKALGGFTLFVSRLSSYSTDQSLKKLFSPFGAVKEARLIRDSVTKKPKGFGFVTFESEIEAQQAVKGMNCRLQKPQPVETMQEALEAYLLTGPAFGRCYI